MRLTWRQLAIFVAVAAGFQLLLYGVSENGRRGLISAEADVRRAQLQLSRVVEIHHLLMNAESGHRGYLITGDVSYLEPLHEAEARIGPLATQLAETYRGNDEQVRDAIQRIGSSAGQRMAMMAEGLDVYHQQGPPAALALAGSVSRVELMATFRAATTVTRDYEQSLLDRSLDQWERKLTIVGRLNLATLLVGLLLATLATIALVRSIRLLAESAAALERQHDQLKAQFDAQARELTDLASSMQQVQENERARLSRNLHDELGGVLLSARMDVTWMEKNGPSDDANVKLHLERLRQALDQGIDLKRRVVEELRPTLLDSMGLFAALRWQAEETCARAKFRCNERYPDDEPRLNRAGAITLFRVVQEGLANAAKHSKADTVDITFEVTDTEILLTIHDDGIGAQASDLSRPRSHGLAGMRHRVNVLGGRLDITSGPTVGTTIFVRVPLANVQAPTEGDPDPSGTFLTYPRAVGSEPAP
jgi:signal transduction histidine kinase